MPAVACLDPETPREIQYYNYYYDCCDDYVVYVFVSVLNMCYCVMYMVDWFVIYVYVIIIITIIIRRSISQFRVPPLSFARRSGAVIMIIIIVVVEEVVVVVGSSSSSRSNSRQK